MNHVLFYPDERSGVEADQTCTLTIDLEGASPQRQLRCAERLRHLHKILRVQDGDLVKVGILGGVRGSARVVELERNRVVLNLAQAEEPPVRLAMRLVLALPRPKFIGRIVQLCATAGIAELYLLNSARVEKSYWSASILTESSLARHLELGLEQGRDTVPPVVCREPSFDHFARSSLPQMLMDGPVVVAHGASTRTMTAQLPAGATVCVGPEGGWLEAEVELLAAAGALSRTLGPRPWRVESAVAAVVSRAIQAP